MPIATQSQRVPRRPSRGVASSVPRTAATMFRWLTRSDETTTVRKVSTTPRQ
jgi:hypothetical protein